jgi:hypothetical protein
VIPLATPNKAVALEDLDDPVWNPVLVGYWFFIGPGIAPTPIIGIVRIDINRDPEGMRAQLIGSGDRSPVESPPGFQNVLFLLGRELIEFG